MVSITVSASKKLDINYIWVPTFVYEDVSVW
jgi:hypothetical protein